MSFAWPIALVLLGLMPLGLVAVRWVDRRRRRQAAMFGGLTATPLSTRRRARVGRALGPALFAVGFSILVLALARPQSVVSLPRLEGTVILTFDVSGSMAATDLQPTRMEAAKAAARAFVEKQPKTVAIGVVAFSDSGFSVQMPTTDSATVLSAVNRLAPTRGTSLGQGILTSLNAIAAAEADPADGFYTNRSPDPSPTPVPAGTHDSALIVLLSDGENTTSPDPLEAAQTAAGRGVRIDTVGIGSAAGSNLKVQGFNVHTQLDEATLKAIAERTDGQYFNADSTANLQAIYGNLDTRLVIKPEAIEITGLFAGAGLLALVFGGLASMAWLGRVP
jgi:Ca-activated chloride channel family protein